MFLKSQLSWNVEIPPESVDSEGLMLQKAILLRLLADFATKKASRDLGYFLAVTTLDHIGEGVVRQHSGEFLFPVDFSCITFKIIVGEILSGTVHKILKHGVFVRCGPAEKIYISHHKMTDYNYVPGENPIFRNEKSGKEIHNGSAVKFLVLDEKYDEAEKDFRAVVSLEGDFLGPI
ncbi:hypothetical protein M569_08802 [Genlisea aurea]|uniref:DNA-directed RNA polymerase subunit n=1 Tax=Genlisea aurea TaxID=192259 RepID=S8E130_9LAMI|nr:hypothetical protein M569_08802 [Genlisea aurea]